MSETSEGNFDVVDLLIKKVAEGLSDEEERQLRASPIDTSRELHKLERAAAAVVLTSLGTRHALPDALRDRLNRQALPFAKSGLEALGAAGQPPEESELNQLSDGEAASTAAMSGIISPDERREAALRETAAREPAAVDLAERRAVMAEREAREELALSRARAARARTSAIVGWLAAAAAAVLAVFLLNRPEAPRPVMISQTAKPQAHRRQVPASPSPHERSAPAQTPSQVPSPQALRDELLARTDSIHWEWKSPDPKAEQPSGDVVWNPAQQRGVVRLVGVPSNDAARQQYQLWFFDEARDARYPVDGGVFDVPPGNQELMLAIQPNHLVSSPKMFAITLEQAGGVVVSKRDHLVLIAKAAT